MDTFKQIKEMATKLSRDCFTKEQALIIMGVDINNRNMFFSSQGNFIFVLSLLSEYIEKLEKNNPLGLSKYDLFDMIKESIEEDDKYDQTS